ncbi:amidohydrolase family protein [Rubrivirga litoralis]|uniref:Amidohydrolase family protein n=1 Tax=Rubrivirga litoralis TaxID=3075598 RepID=A0ABU3BMV3_9BACT|nr:amidohydrolase family protein [Rubrivirga sp. F394]MDT0630630.1 amidohydrolase family protein [Rubrivirga sp. F394]
MALRHRLAAVAALACCLALPARAQGISAETPLRPVTQTLALTNARVVTAPGEVLERATVVVRDGRIEAVGRDVAVPFDARVVEADSFTVYAAFVDAFGTAGIKKAESPDERYEGDRGAPPRELAGITPDRQARDLYDPTDARVKQLREAGFGAAHVAPQEGLFSGRGAVVLLRETGRQESAPALVLDGPASTVARLDPASGVYPATVMGVLAVLRETVENARRRDASRLAFDEERGGTARPRFDPVLDGLRPLIDGDGPFVFAVDGWLDGFRALRASGEMGLTPILAGVPDAAPLVEKLRAGRTAVFAPLALPDTVAADTSAAGGAAPAVDRPTISPGEASFISNRRILSYRDTEGEKTALTGQRREAVARFERSPAALAAAEVPFAFATLDVKPGDIHANLHRMVEAGLSPDDALEALTIGPARLLGVDRDLGTVEEGKLANLVVTVGDLFTDSTEVRHVIVEGVAYEVEGGGGVAGADPDAVVQAVGTWDYEVSTPAGAQEGRFTVEGSAGSFTGTITGDGETDPLTSVTVEGNVLTMTFQSDDVGTVTIAGTIADDEFSGTAEIASFGSFPITATRRPE